MELQKIIKHGMLSFIKTNEIINFDGYYKNMIDEPIFKKIYNMSHDYLFYNKYIKPIIFDLLYKYWRGKKMCLFNLNTDVKAALDIFMNDNENINNFDITKKVFNKTIKTKRIIKDV